MRERSPKINFELQGTDSVQGQIYNHIFAQNRDSCDNCPSNILQRARKKKKQLTLFYLKCLLLGVLWCDFINKIFPFFCNSQITFSYLELRLISVDVWFEKWRISLGLYPRISPSFCWRMFSHCDTFRLVAREQKIFYES